MKMIEGITQIGQILLAEDETRYLDLLIQNMFPERKGRKQHVVAMDFDCEARKVDFRILGAVDDQTAHKYLWIGNASSNDPQLRLSSNQIAYLVSQSVPLLRDSLPEDSELREQLDKILGTFFFDLGEIGGRQKRYRYVLDITGIAPELNLTERKAAVQNDEVKAKDVVQDVSKAVEKYIDQTLQVASSEISLYTICLNGEILAQSRDYKDFLIRDNLLPDFDDKSSGNCFICNQDAPVSYDVAKLDFKYYMKDKLSFSSNFQGGFDKNFSFCRSCYMKLSSGENFIQTKLRTNIGGFSIYIIPKFLFDAEMSPDRLRKLSEHALFHFNTAKSFRGLEIFYDKLGEYTEYEEEQNTFILNVLFYQRHQREMKVLKLIKDVPPARLKKLIQVSNEVGTLGDKLLRESRRWYIDLGKIYYLSPIRMSKGDPKAYKELLNLYSTIISGGTVSYPAIIKQFTELIRVYKFEKFRAYNIKEPNNVLWEMSTAVVQCSFFLLYLRELGLLRGGRTMTQTDLTSLNLEHELEAFIRSMGYNDAQTALFLMGHLIGQIGWKQGGKEPILEKISYQGMDDRRLLRLANEVFEKLKQYRILSKYSKYIFSACKLLLDKQIQNWPLDDQENVFYILSGYSFRRQLAAAGDKSSTEEEDENDAEQ